MTASDKYHRFVALGELLVRLSTKRGELLSTARHLNLDIGGSEANVAAALATLGHGCAMISAVPATALGDAAVMALRGRGVDSRAITRGQGRMGLYWLERGAGHRPAEIIYDREASAFSTLNPALIDWHTLLRDADRLHLSGITVALSESATRLTLDASAAAIAMGVPISFDCNYRSHLWAARGGVQIEPLIELASRADILFGNYRDIALFLGSPLEGNTVANRRDAATAAFAAFPRLRLIASTTRSIHDAERHGLSARVDTRVSGCETETADVPFIVDRIGTGDAFVAGILHGDVQQLPLEVVASHGLALGALKHTVQGDMAGLDQRYLDKFSLSSCDVDR